MSLRELVSGAGCSAGAGSSNNPLAGLTDKILGGGSSKASAEAVRGEQGLQAQQPFLQGAGPSAGDVLHMPYGGRGAGGLPLAAAGGAAFMQAFAGPQQAVPSSPLFESQALAATFHSFIASAKSGEALMPAPVEMLSFSEIEKMKIRERSAALSRQLILGPGGPEMAAQHTMQLLHALNIDAPPGGFAAATRDHPFLREFAQDFPQGVAAPGMHGGDWANEFAEAPGGHAWAGEFAVAHPRPQWGRPPPMMGPAGAGPDWSQEFLHGGPRMGPEIPADIAARFGGAVSLSEDRAGGEWASEFAAQRGEGSAAGASSSGRVVGGNHTRALVETLAANKEPKFQNSRFLQFVSKMSRGDLVFEGGQAVPRAGGGGAWAEEFASARPPAGADAWASEFAQQRGLPAAAGPGSAWASEFAQQRGGGAAGTWADEFAGAPQEWADEFTQVHGGEVPGEEWAEAYEQFLASVQDRDMHGPASRGQYDFVENNPYLTHEDPLGEGRALFRSGVLSEAVLALEAAVRRDESNSEAWRLLGTVHAENDDDRRAIAAMSNALRADPDNLEVLLSLSVSHTNELDSDEALGYMASWLGKHPRYAAVAAAAAAAAGGPEAAAGAQGLMERFQRAAALHPGDADVHAVVGVLCNLLRQYDDAVVAFEKALEINPSDYSLWNKLGATLANSARSGEALGAYRRALDLKPNYVRAWTNMGIGYANQGEYAQSAAYYVRALSLNPRADSVWGYLRMSLSCLGMADMFPALDAHDLGPLQSRFVL